jgi:CheY-like chemotaxis protein/anti-sigma regulatory factor (Ser/Thr protein kinase)
MATVLVVDDLAVDRQLAGEFLSEDTDIRVTFAENGADALAKMAEELPELVVTDLVMPEIDGLELVARVKSQYPLTPVVLMTSQGSEEIAVRALQQGAASYIPKRSLAWDLLETVQKVLSASAHRHVHRRLMGCMARNEREFALANDPTLFRPLVSHLQDSLVHMGICEDTDLTRIGVALEEALANALFHGNLEVSSELRGLDDDAYHALVRERRSQEPYRSRRIYVRAELSQEKGVFAVRDEGPGFELASLPDPTDPANLEKASGRGILLMETFMDRVDFNELGNMVTLTKNRNSKRSPKPGASS